MRLVTAERARAPARRPGPHRGGRPGWIAVALALVAYGAHPASAAAAVLLDHAIVFWIPALIGTAAFLRLRATLDEPVAASA